MFDSLEQDSRSERAVIRCLLCLTGFVPATALLALWTAKLNWDPKFGFGGSMTFIVFLISIPFVGCLFAVVLSSYLGFGRGSRAHVLLGIVFSFIGLATSDFVSGLPVQVSTAIVIAVIAGAAAGFAFELTGPRVSVEVGRSN